MGLKERLQNNIGHGVTVYYRRVGIKNLFTDSGIIKRIEGKKLILGSIGTEEEGFVNIDEITDVEIDPKKAVIDLNNSITEDIEQAWSGKYGIICCICCLILLVIFGIVFFS